MNRRKFRKLNYQSMICKTERMRVCTKIPSILPDSGVDSNTDCSSCSSDEITDPVQEFADYTNKLTSTL